MRSFGILAFRSGLEYYNFDFSELTGNNLCTSCENLLRFGLVILAKEVVQPELIIVAMLSSVMFAMGWGC